MDLVVTLAVLLAGGLHGLTFATILAKTFRLHHHNLFVPKQMAQIEAKVSKLMANTILMTFIVMSNIAWTDYFINPMRVYAGAGLIVGGIIFVLIVIGWLAD